MARGKKRRILTALALFVLVGAGGVAAQTTQDPVRTQSGDPAIQNRVFTLGEIEVTGKSEQETNPTATHVYDEDMRKFDRNDLAGAAALAPGVNVTRSGARNETMVNVRGFDVRHAPIFLDGIPIYVPYDGYPDLGRFLTFDLSQVVISKAFTSVLYGPNTMGGAINMVSKRPIEKFEATGGAGVSENDYHTYLNLGSNQGNWYVQASGAYVDSEHYRMSSDFESVPVEDGDWRNRSSRSDVKGSVKLGLTPNATDEYALTYINQQADKDVPPYTGSNSNGLPVRYWSWPYWNKQSVYFNSNTSVLDASYVKSRLYYDKFTNSLQSYDNSSYATQTTNRAFDSAYDDYTTGGSVEAGTRLIPDHLLKMAVHYKADIHREQGNSGYPWLHFREDVYSVGLEDAWTINPEWRLIGGASYDYMDVKEAEDYNSSTRVVSEFDTPSAWGFNPQLGLFRKVGEDGLAHASVAFKTRLPTIKDRYSYKLGRAIPNPDLDTEKSVNYELGYKHDLFDKKLSLEGAVFYYDISDFILSRTIPNPSNPSTTTTQNQNVGDVQEHGFELGFTFGKFAGFSGGANYAYIAYDAQNSSDKLLNTPGHKVFAFLEYEIIENLSALADLEYVSKLYNSTASSMDGARTAGDYALVGAKLGYRFLDHYTAEVGVSNLFDNNYEIDEGFPEAGRTFFANVRFEF